ncbi:putative glyoxalase superfamily protein PhnB [Sphingomonas sp. BE138]|uniref:VOC family protein n=1 Tax=Sphingomonas sp. BE138 TaxID=2817845 RepID=UPI002857784D|nr:VOC family protein [Sphingomonas sp. BE138]MDR6790660.1 putative glyoxalase superfamily protein PhnB [Sphingomonas sp. BE138]
MSVRPAIIPNIRYADAPAAIDFLCRGFGFTKHAVYPDANQPNCIAHAQLVRDGQMIMVSSAQQTPFAAAAPMATVAEAGANTQSIYVVLDDIDDHASVARQQGGDIFMGPEDQPQGGRSYSVRDPEGNAWTFGSYDPYAS